jgi:hypothetical protein
MREERQREREREEEMCVERKSKPLLFGPHEMWNEDA